MLTIQCLFGNVDWYYHYLPNGKHDPFFHVINYRGKQNILNYSPPYPPYFPTIVSLINFWKMFHLFSILLSSKRLNHHETFERESQRIYASNTFYELLYKCFPLLVLDRGIKKWSNSANLSAVYRVINKITYAALLIQCKISILFYLYPIYSFLKNLSEGKIHVRLSMKSSLKLHAYDLVTTEEWMNRFKYK